MSGIQQSAATVTWQPPTVADQNGLITGYTLYLSVPGQANSELLAVESQGRNWYEAREIGQDMIVHFSVLQSYSLPTSFCSG